MTAKEVKKTLERLGVPDDKPILLKLVKGYHDVRLVLAGGGATDDPEGAQVLNDVREAAGRDPDIYLLDLPSNAHLAINALQRAATIVIQKSTRRVWPDRG
jgi:trehalose synthase